MQNQKINYDTKLKELVKAERGKNVLLHCCCGPCASHCFSVLTGNNQDFSGVTESLKGDLLNKFEGGDDGFNVTAFYYNPAIMPQSEYEKRAATLKKLCCSLGISYLEGVYDNDKHLQQIKGLEHLAEGGERCRICFYDRLLVTAIAAKERGFDYFCTTLTLSPHKNSRLINELGFEISAKIGVSYLASDFKKGNGYLNSIELSSFFGLYRQDYCGCIFSKRE